MEITVASPLPFVERRRPYAVAPRGVGFVERRRPTPVLLRDVDDLHDVDLDGVLADQMPFGVTAAQAGETAAALAALIGTTVPTALLAHDLSPVAQTFAA